MHQALYGGCRLGDARSQRHLPAAGDDQEDVSARFSSAEGMTFQPIERFATPDRVFDDMWATFRISGDGFENCPFPIGTKVKIRLLHNFHIRDGMIAKGNWLRNMATRRIEDRVAA
jgi:hypothetical protein